MQLGEYDQAEDDFEKRTNWTPAQSLSAAAQEMAAVQASDLDRALATVQAKLAREPTDALLLHVQADILAQKGADPGTPEFQLAVRSARKESLCSPRLAPLGAKPIY